MIPTMAISFFEIYQNVEAAGLLTLDSLEEIINIIPNIPDTLRLTSFLEVPIISELALTARAVAVSVLTAQYDTHHTDDHLEHRVQESLLKAHAFPRKCNNYCQIVDVSLKMYRW